MTDNLAAPSPARQWLKAFYSALAAAIGYIIAELIMQHDTSFILIGALAILAVLTPIIYAINRRSGRTAPRR
ncbi:hypothetical protein AB0O16_00025 [Microbacterium sp. NPDC089180]|uniref:Uncharacterized protein n=1 Tax=Microbacterium galbum TaxID=3075994 RepID=A0ABU3T467_9MICO|nr:hypothetical protein [Microbacterium sp. KSW4-17]MDU0366172.1 hypothetical protein [Microbacterium sp. KSW4-17]